MKKIGKEQVRKARQTLAKYKEGKAVLDKRIVSNEQWWKLRHWGEIGYDKDDTRPMPASAWLFNSLANKHADAMDCYPEPTVLPREPGDRAEAAKLTRILPAILKKNQFKRTYSSAWWYKLKSGCAVYGVFWDAGKLNGLGDVSIRRMDLLNLFLGAGRDGHSGLGQLLLHGAGKPRGAGGAVSPAEGKAGRRRVYREPVPV